MRDRYERAGGVSSPAFSLRFSGPVIVAGNAWCLHDDISEARKTWPDAPVIACNGAAREVKAIALYSRHPERFTEHPYDWIGRQRRKFGDGFTVHSSNIERNGAALTAPAVVDPEGGIEDSERALGVHTSAFSGATVLNGDSRNE